MMSKNRYSKIKKTKGQNQLFSQQTMIVKNDLNCTEFAINAINQQTRQCKKNYLRCEMIKMDIL